MLIAFRGSIYGIPPIDKLSVQQLAGRIIPAMATTTAVVSGLVGQELVKVAAEIDNFRKRFSGIQSLSNPARGEEIGLRNRLHSLGSSLRGLLTPKPTVTHISDRLLLDKERILGRFRNSFVDLDGPTVAQSEPAAAEQFMISSNKLKKEPLSMKSFNLWDAITVSLEFVTMLYSFLCSIN